MYDNWLKYILIKKNSNNNDDGDDDGFLLSSSKDWMMLLWVLGLEKINGNKVAGCCPWWMLSA